MSTNSSSSISRENSSASDMMTGIDADRKKRDDEAVDDDGKHVKHHQGRGHRKQLSETSKKHGGKTTSKTKSHKLSKTTTVKKQAAAVSSGPQADIDDNIDRHHATTSPAVPRRSSIVVSRSASVESILQRRASDCGNRDSSTERPRQQSMMMSEAGGSRRGSTGSACESTSQLVRQKSKVRFQEGDGELPLARPPSTKRPSIDGTTGARKLGRKWSMLISGSDVGGSGEAIEAAAPIDVDRAEAAMAAADSETFPPAAPRRAKGSDVINPTVNGMRQFGITKGVISRAIVKFTSPPVPRPLTVCFHFPGTFLTHRYVLDMVRSKIQLIEGNGTGSLGKVSTIQFIDRNTIHGTQGMDNRWLVTLTNGDCVDILLRQGLHLFNRKITLRRYDEITNEEYAEFIEYRSLHNKLYAKNEESRDDGTSTAAAGGPQDAAAAAVGRKGADENEYMSDEEQSQANKEPVTMATLECDEDATG